MRTSAPLIEPATLLDCMHMWARARSRKAMAFPPVDLDYILYILFICSFAADHPTEFEPVCLFAADHPTDFEPVLYLLYIYIW